MKLKNTKTKLGFQPSQWEYHKTRIDTSKIIGIKLTIYDNAPELAPVYENDRYKVKCQVWLRGKCLADKSDYELTNKLGQFKTFKNNMYKQDQYRSWYVKTVSDVRDTNQGLGSDAVTMAACLGMRQNNADGQRGYAHVPEWAFALHLVPGYAPYGKLYCGEYAFDIHPDDEYTVNGTKAYVMDLEFEQDETDN